MIIDKALINKSIAYGERYTSETFNKQHSALFGECFVVSGFALTDLSSDGNFSISLGPGVFSSRGILVQITSETTLTLAEAPTTPKLLVASTEDNSPDTPVSIDILSPNDVTENMTTLGYYTPPLNFEDIATGAFGGVRSHFYRPASHHALNELAADMSTGMKTESHLGTVVQASLVGADYRVESSGIPLASEDPNLLVFFRGCLLEEDTHYYIESPGTLLIRGGVTLVRENGVDLTFDANYAHAFVDLVYSSDFLFRQKYTYSTPTGDYMLGIPQAFLDQYAKGTFEAIVFANASSTVGSTLLGSDRCTPSTQNNSRDSVTVAPRAGFTVTQDGFVTEELSPQAIAEFTVIGVRGMGGASTLVREDGSTTPQLPIVDGNRGHLTLAANYVETRIPYKVESGELQVFVDGRLCPCDHFKVNNIASTTPNLNSVGGARYSSDKNSSAIELGTQPIHYSREQGNAHTPLDFAVVDSLNFRPSYLAPRTRDLTYGSDTFGGLTEAISTPGIPEALFNLAGNRYFDDYGSNQFEFADSTGLAFNGNYFVTYQSLAGIDTDTGLVDGPIDVSASLFTSLAMSVTMFSDVPLGVGLSMEAAHQLNHAADDGANPAGWFFEDETTIRKVPTAADGSALINSATGLYDIQVDPDNFFSENNPIVTYAALDAYLQPWMDSFGFYDTATAPRAHKRNAGVVYDSSGEITSSFSDLLNNNVVLPGKSLVQTLDIIASKVAGEKVPIATAHGHAYGGRVINLTKGTVGPKVDGSSGNVAPGLIFPTDVGFNHGSYYGNLGFESPFKKLADWDSPQIRTFIADYPNDSNHGIFSIPGTGLSALDVGESSFTGNNITCMISPIPSGCPGFLHGDEVTITKYRFIHLHAGSFNEITDSTALSNMSSPPDIGVEIVALTKGGDNGGSASRNALVQWTVFGKLDQTVAKHTHTNAENEFFYFSD
jgi:hypothetical protein